MNITFTAMDANKQATCSAPLNPGDIPGAVPYQHNIQSGDTLTLAGNSGVYHILTLIGGQARFLSGGRDDLIAERATYVPAPDQDVTIQAETAVSLFEIQWQIAPGDTAELAAFQTRFPVIQPYRLAKQYRDRNKSDKTISRVIIEQRTIPRFAMGSVETFGPDCVKAHDHPMLDQYFFSFPENDAFITIEGEPYRMLGNQLLYIPLESLHGVDVVQKKHCHYMWIDFMVDETAMHRLDTSHIATGTMRTLEEET